MTEQQTTPTSKMTMRGLSANRTPMIKQFYNNGWGYLRVQYMGKAWAWFGPKVEVELHYKNWLTEQQL
jgi:hypothetical protein